MGRLRTPDDCPHASIIRREADAGTPLNGLYCLDCGSLVKRATGGLGGWARVGPLMEASSLTDLRSKLGWEKDVPDNIRLDPAAPGYHVPDGPKD
jgi:hypothetical protein